MEEINISPMKKFHNNFYYLGVFFIMAHIINRISRKKKKNIFSFLCKQGSLFLFQIKISKVGDFFAFFFGGGRGGVIGFGLLFCDKNLQFSNQL